MNQKEYGEWKGDERVGLCPFCGAPGWIGGDDEWCEHYLGSHSLAGCPPYITFADREPYASFLQYNRKAFVRKQSF